MKYAVRIADKSYEVEIEDIHARPVIARVDGQTFEVIPENGMKPAPALNRRADRRSHVEAEVEGVENEVKEIQVVALPKSSPSRGINLNELTAPLPGTVIEIFIKTDEQIEAGQVILVIEAMKMKNSIRSTRSGKIAEVLVSPGETVAHKQALVRFG